MFSPRVSAHHCQSPTAGAGVLPPPRQDAVPNSTTSMLGAASAHHGAGSRTVAGASSSSTSAAAVVRAWRWGMLRLAGVGCPKRPGSVDPGGATNTVRGRFAYPSNVAIRPRFFAVFARNRTQDVRSAPRRVDVGARPRDGRAEHVASIGATDSRSLDAGTGPTFAAAERPRTGHRVP